MYISVIWHYLLLEAQLEGLQTKTARTSVCSPAIELTASSPSRGAVAVYRDRLQNAEVSRYVRNKHGTIIGTIASAAASAC